MSLAIAPLEQGMTRDTFAILDRAALLAAKIADTEFVPKDFRKRPEAVLAAILAGYELGVQPMVALSNIAVINGRPSIGANLARAIILSNGHEIWPEESTITRCVMKARRRDSSHIYEAIWTREQAERARLLGKDNWRYYPQDMLFARSTGQLWRWAFADLMAGIPYLREELEDGDVLEPQILQGGNGVQAPSSSGGRHSRRRQIRQPESRDPSSPPPEPPLEPVQAGEAAESTPRPAPPAEESPQPEAAAPPPPSAPESDDEVPEYRGGKQPPSDAQRVAIACREAGLDRAHLIKAVTSTKTSARELSAPEAGDVINAARAVARGERALVEVDGHWSVLDVADAPEPSQLPLEERT